MTRRTETRQFVAAGSQESLFAAGDQLAATLTARSLPVITSGRTEVAVRCPGCKEMHRHTGLGDKVGPCGTAYTVAAKRGRAS